MRATFIVEEGWVAASGAMSDYGEANGTFLIGGQAMSAVLKTVKASDGTYIERVYRGDKLIAENDSEAGSEAFDEIDIKYADKYDCPHELRKYNQGHGFVCFHCGHVVDEL